MGGLVLLINTLTAAYILILQKKHQLINERKFMEAATQRQDAKVQTTSAVRAVAAVAHEAKEAAGAAVKGIEDTRTAINGRVEQLIEAAGAVGEAKGANDERARADAKKEGEQRT